MPNFATVSEELQAVAKFATTERIKKHKGKYQSGQMGQTVNLLAYAFGGSNPSLPTKFAEIAQLVEH